MNTNASDRIRKFLLGGDTLRYLTLSAIIILLYVLFAATSPGFLSFNTVMNIARQAGALALASIAMTMIMLTGGIDLSVSSVIAFSGACGALAMQAVGGTGVATGLVGVLATLAASLSFGLLNGFAVGYLHIAPFIVTLATQALARGLTLTVTDSSRVLVVSNLYNAPGQYDLFGRIPLSLVLVLVCYVLAHLLLSKTTFGRKTYAIGDNVVASKAAGINVSRHTLAIYAASSVFVALATMVIVGRVRSAQPLAAVAMEFDVITAVVLGGTSLLGGQGNLKGTILGVVLTSVIFTGLSMLHLPPFVDYIVKGFLILFAVLSNWLIEDKLGVYLRGRREVRAAPASHLVESDNTTVSALLSRNAQTVLSLNHISKSFPGVRALDDVSFSIKRGSVHALVGENGAGKSTLMKILSGVYRKDGGEILIDGKPVEIRSPVDSQAIGISVIYQELANVPELNVSQNVNLGREVPSRIPLITDEAQMRGKTARLLAKFHLEVPPTRKMDRLTIGQQQMVEIAKAYGSNAWIVVMDEPTSAITEADKESLFEIIRELKNHNIAVVYISHRMSEIFEIADEITVLRDGKHVVTGPVGDFDENSIITHMVGRELSDIFTREGAPHGEVALRVENLSRAGAFEPISFEVRRGEVLGFSGLMGAGRTEIMRCVCGLDRSDSGEIRVDGNPVRVNRPSDAIAAGIVMVSEDRRREGIIPHISVQGNTTLASLDKVSRLGWIDPRKDLATARNYIDKLEIRTPSPEQLIMNLSGGNQQKVCLAKWLNCDPKVIILDEPTRGIDVGAKAEIHKLIDALTRQGMAVILISSELPEIIGASDRIIVLYEGKVMREFRDKSAFTQELLMKSAAGMK